MDISAVALTLINTFLSVILCFIAYKIGIITGFVNLWKIIVVGFALGAVGRLVLTFAEAEAKFFLCDFKDLGLGFVFASRLLLIIGFCMFLNVAKKMGKINGS